MILTANIIGGGLAGSITAALLRQNGIKCNVFDPGNDLTSASAASSNLFIEHWLKNLASGDQAKTGIAILKNLYGPHIDYPFAKGLGYAMKVGHIHQCHILDKNPIRAKVKTVEKGGVVTCDGLSYGADVQVICTGWRTPELDPESEVDVKVGHCILFEGQIPPGESLIRIVSPYKHEKFYQFGPDRVYYADSVALDLKSYQSRKEEILARTRERAHKLAKGMTEISVLTGYRPITHGHDFGYCKFVKPGVWAITGGGKNGMVAYACAAQTLLHNLQRQ